MNHNDPDQNFSREISLFDKIIRKLEELPAADMQSSSMLSDVKEGGNFEHKSR